MTLHHDHHAQQQQNPPSAKLCQTLPTVEYPTKCPTVEEVLGHIVAKE